jgi:histidinol-phosphate phosphatase family protein
MSRPAVFVDRDGTIIEDRVHIALPENVVLLPGAADAIRRLNDAELPVIVVTNQSGIARGLFTMQDYEAVRGALDAELRAAGAHVLASYVCPHHPDFTGPCECRKPGTLLYREAAAAHDVDLARSYFVGDRWRDVAPALAFGGHGILVANHETPDAERERARREADMALSLADAVERILSGGL